MRIIKGRIRPLLRDDHGSAALEFALIVPVVLGLIFAMADLGRMMITDSILQSALSSLASEQRYLQPQNQTALSAGAALTNLQDILARKGAGWIDGSKINLSITGAGTGGNGSLPVTGGQFLRYEISYPFSLGTPLINSLIDERFLIRKAKLIVRNISA